jgi:hypothetical protein
MIYFYMVSCSFLLFYTFAVLACDRHPVRDMFRAKPFLRIAMFLAFLVFFGNVPLLKFKS